MLGPQPVNTRPFVGPVGWWMFLKRGRFARFFFGLIENSEEMINFLMGFWKWWKIWSRKQFNRFYVIIWFSIHKGSLPKVFDTLFDRFKDRCVTNCGVDWCQLPCTRNMFKASCQARSHVLTLIECKRCTMHSWIWTISVKLLFKICKGKYGFDDATADEGYKNSVGKQFSRMALFKIVFIVSKVLWISINFFSTMYVL